MGTGVVHKQQFIAVLLVTLLICSVPAAAESYSLSYDANGNIVEGIGHYYEYNDFNQLVRVRESDANGRILAEFEYDHEGNRLKKVEYDTQGRKTTTYTIGKEFTRVVDDPGSHDTVYYHDEFVLVGRKDPDGKRY